MMSTNRYDLTKWLPTTKKELEIRGWDTVDVILFSGDAYVDHPSFGSAVVGRLIESMGLRVAIVPQPDWRGDHRDFTKLGKPNYFFAISSGCMDSMVNHYTANKRLRSDDAYTAGGKAGSRPDYATITYSTILKQLYPDVPVVIGGIEASLRRLTHYDYWSDKLMPSILVDSKADLLVYGMGEEPLREICSRLISGAPFSSLTDIQQTAYLRPRTAETETGSIVFLHSHEACVANKHDQAANFKIIEEESNKWQARTIIQAIGPKEVVVNTPFPPMSTEALDRVYELPFTRLPHPKYKDKQIPAYEMIRFSVNIHRGCFGGCAFCTISAHQGKFIVNRSKQSILKEVETLTGLAEFKGYLSDLGGPSANMYGMAGKDLSLCRICKKPSCIHPVICKNLDTNHNKLIDIYQAVDALPGIKKSFIGSGIRYDLLFHEISDGKNTRLVINPSNQALTYLKEIVKHHISGRLKVAPEHTSDAVLYLMRKPSFALFKAFNDLFNELENQRVQESHSGKQQLIPYFISSHPGCNETDMAELAAETKALQFKLEQVQDFTPTPMTLATEIYYSGLNPYSLKPVYTAKSKPEKLAQRSYFFWYENETRNLLIRRLKQLNRPDLIKKLLG